MRAPFAVVEGAIRDSQQLLDGNTVMGANGYANADGDWRLFAVSGQTFRNSAGNLVGCRFFRLRENQGKLIAAVTGGGVGVAGVGPEDIR